MALAILCNGPLQRLPCRRLFLVQIFLTPALVGGPPRLCPGAGYLPQGHTLVFGRNVYLMPGLLDAVGLYPLLHLVVVERGFSGGKRRLRLLQLRPCISVIHLRDHFARAHALVVVHLQSAQRACYASAERNDVGMDIGIVGGLNTRTAPVIPAKQHKRKKQRGGEQNGHRNQPAGFTSGSFLVLRRARGHTFS